MGVEGGVVGVLLERRCAGELGPIAFSLTDEEMDKSCGSLGVVGIGGEKAAIGGFSRG